MSLENQVTRVSQGMKDTLKTLINKLGGNVTDELIDQYPSIASALDDVEPAGSAQQALRDAKSYTDQKILEIPTPDVSGQIGTHNADANAHVDIRSSISNHTSDANIHVTAEEKTAWNAKAASTHASQHASDGSDPITPAAIGAAASSHNHDDRYYTETEVNTLLSAKAPSTHASQHASGGSDPITPASIGAAASSHNHSATNITSGTLAVARGGTGQTTLTPSVGTKGLRQIYAGTSDMTAGSSALTTGVVYFVYE